MAWMTGWTDEEFARRYEAFEAQQAPTVERDLTTTDEELRDLVGFLIQRRERLRDEQISTLEERTRELIVTIERNKKEILLEELRCFKEVLALQRQLLVEDDEPRH